jgi:nucleotide-binding universal stress UspA family protein
MTTLQLAAPPPPLLAGAGTAFQRVLLAIDFGRASLGAARWATTHVIPQVDAVLTHVMPFVEESTGDESEGNAEREPVGHMTPALVGGLAGFGAMLDVSAFRSVVRIGRPSACLATTTDEAGADLMVLGRRADANRIRVGEPNVIERAARRTSASVLVVPEGTTNAPEHIVAAIDDSRFAPRVLRVANWLARIHELPLTVLHVLAPAVGAYNRVVRSAKHRFERAVARESTEILMGDAAREIVLASMARGLSLLVVGMRGADEAPAGSVGSVARELISRAPMPVLAVNAV